MKYKVGDRVKIVSKPTPNDWRGEFEEYWASGMNKYIWKTMTIDGSSIIDRYYNMKEDNG